MSLFPSTLPTKMFEHSNNPELLAKGEVEKRFTSYVTNTSWSFSDASYSFKSCSGCDTRRMCRIELSYCEPARILYDIDTME